MSLVRDRDGAPAHVIAQVVDLTDHLRAVRERDDARALVETAFEHAPIGNLLTRLEPDGDSVVVQANPAMAAMLDMEVDDLLGRNGAFLTHPDDLPARERMVEELKAGRPARSELRMLRRGGDHVWVDLAVVPIPSDDGSVLVLSQALDISDRKQLELKLRRLADEDALTGIYNRRRFEAELTREAARVRRHGGSAAVLLLDLDGFKAVNDTRGHAAGDALLVRVAEALRSSLRGIDVVGRIGGDEFAVLLPETGEAGARAVGAKVRDAVREQCGHGVTASLGHAVLVGALADADAALVEADAAMYAAKAGRRSG